MLAHRPPFVGKTRVDTLAKITSEPHEPLHQLRPEVPPSVSSLVDQLLEKTPELRPSSASIVAQRLAALLDEQVATTPRDNDSWQDLEPTLDASNQAPAAPAATKGATIGPSHRFARRGNPKRLVRQGGT